MLSEVNSVTWLDYVKLWSGGASDTEIAKATGVAISTVGRWDRSEPKPAHVKAFALKYRRPVLEAFLAAGFLSEEQAGENVSSPDLRTLADEQLLREVQLRMKGARHEAQEPRSEATGAELGGSRAQGAPIGAAAHPARGVADQGSTGVSPTKSGGSHGLDLQPAKASGKEDEAERGQEVGVGEPEDRQAGDAEQPGQGKRARRKGHPVQVLDPTQHAGMSGTAPQPPTQGDMDLAALPGAAAHDPTQRARDEQDRDYPDEEGPEGGA